MKKIIRNFKSYFFKGLAALLPTILSIWLLVQFYNFLQANVSRHINESIVKLILSLTDEYSREFLESFWVYGKGQIVGFVIPLILVCVLGAILASVVGKTIWHSIDRFLRRLPVIKRVYPYLKQITDFAFSDDRPAFKKVVGVEYPRKGIWALGLVTGSGMKTLSEAGDFHEELLTIFIPSSPTPFTGYVIMVRKEDTIDLDISIEEALRFTISGGVVTPSEWREKQGGEGIGF